MKKLKKQIFIKPNHKDTHFMIIEEYFRKQTEFQTGMAETKISKHKL